MKKMFAFVAFFMFALTCASQTLIHSHNDYKNPVPLLNALESKAWSIEADVFLVRGSVLVGHTLKETTKKKSLQSLYIQPIISLYKRNNGKISADSSYLTNLVIDIKQNDPELLNALVDLFNPLGYYFDRSVNPYAVQIIISGHRGPISDWESYPSFLFFDGRPFEDYDTPALRKVAMISDNYFKYIDTRSNRGDSTKIRLVINKSKAINKPVRFWGSPDNEGVWQFLVQCGVDILNTDKPIACRAFLNTIF